MWIRSQNKEKLIYCTNFAIKDYWSGLEKEGWGWDIISNSTWVGTYSTEGKALKVLDMIQERICIIEEAKIVFPVITRDNRMFIENREDFVFQMPLDSEVEALSGME